MIHGGGQEGFWHPKNLVLQQDRTCSLRQLRRHIISIKQLVRDRFCAIQKTCPISFKKQYADTLKELQQEVGALAIYAETVMCIPNASTTIINLERIVKRICMNELQSRRALNKRDTLIREYRKQLAACSNNVQTQARCRHRLQQWSELFDEIGMPYSTPRTLDTATYVSLGMLPNSSKCTASQYHTALKRIFDIEMRIMQDCYQTNQTCISHRALSDENNVRSMIASAASCEDRRAVEDDSMVHWAGTNVDSSYYFSDVMNACAAYDVGALDEFRLCILYDACHVLYRGVPFTQEAASIAVSYHIGDQLRIDLARIDFDELPSMRVHDEVICALEKINSIDHTAESDVYCHRVIYRTLRDGLVAPVVSSEAFVQVWLSKLMRLPCDGLSHSTHVFCRAMISNQLVEDATLAVWIASWKSAVLKGFASTIHCISNTLRKYVTCTNRRQCIGLTENIELIRSMECMAAPECAACRLLHDRFMGGSCIAPDKATYHDKLTLLLQSIGDAYSAEHGGRRELSGFHPNYTMVQLDGCQWSLCLASILLYISDAGPSGLHRDAAGASAAQCEFLLSRGAIQKADDGKLCRAAHIPAGGRFMFEEAAEAASAAPPSTLMLEVSHRAKANAVHAVKRKPAYYSAQALVDSTHGLEQAHVDELIATDVLEQHPTSGLISLT